MEGKGTLMEPGEEAVVVAEGGHAWWKLRVPRKEKKEEEAPPGRGA